MLEILGRENQRSQKSISILSLESQRGERKLNDFFSQNEDDFMMIDADRVPGRPRKTLWEMNRFRDELADNSRNNEYTSALSTFQNKSELNRPALDEHGSIYYQVLPPR